MITIGESPHPKVLFVGYGSQDPKLAEMLELVPTSKLWDGRLDSIRLADWDAIVSCASFQFADTSHAIQVLAFPGAALPMLDLDEQHRGSVRSGELEQPSVVMSVNETLPDLLTRLISEEMVPAMQMLEKRPLLSFSDNRSGFRMTRRLSIRPSGMLPAMASNWLISDPDGTLVSGSYKIGAGGNAWWVPFTPTHPVRWLAALLEVWGSEHPEEFPSLSAWRNRPRWMSEAETVTTNRIAEKQNDLARIVAARRRAIERLQDQLRSDTVQADSGARRLLTAQGDELLDAAAKALESFGFVVIRVDETIPPGESKKEDLRVTSPDGGTAIAEVKGYEHGAKQRDLYTIANYAGLYLAETGALPERRWYICNSFCESDPDTRPEILQGANDALALFARDCGAAIDSRELFRLLRAVESGQVSQGDARLMLWESPIRFVAPSDEDALQADETTARK